MASPAERTRHSPQLISRVPYLPGLDGMRALAVVAVMVYHANKTWLAGGFLGVEVFFVISGYLITLLLVAEHERDDSVSLRGFWARRARRLLPALWLMLVLVVVYTAFWRSDDLGALRGDVVFSLLYVENWFQIVTGQGYTAVNDFAPLRHLWSLAVEEQFYVLWPLVMLVVLRFGRRRLPRTGAWMFALAVVVAVAVALLYHPGPISTCDVTPEAYFRVGERCLSKMDTLYLSTPTRLGGLLLGSGLAMWWRPMALRRGPVREKGRLFDLLGLLGLIGLGALMWVTHLETSVVDVGVVASRFLFQGGLFLTGLVTLAVIMAVTHPGSLLRRLLGNPVFVWVGTRSYGLYLFHWPIYQIIRGQAGELLEPSEFLVAMAATLALTELSFRLVEMPIRRGAIGRYLRSLRGRSPAAVIRRRRLLVGGMLAAVIPVVAGVELATAELRQNDVQQTIDQGEEFVVDVEDLLGTTTTSTVAPSVGPSTTVKPRRTTTTTTTTPPPKEKIDVFAIGDSVMLGAAESLSRRGAVVDAQVSRQGVEGRDLLQQYGAADLFKNAVVIHLGTNGEVSEQTYDEMIEATKAVNLVVVLTIRADRSWTASNNALIMALPSKHPTVKVLDWAALSNECPGDCFATDDIHLDADGQEYYARLIYEALGRA